MIALLARESSHVCMHCVSPFSPQFADCRTKVREKREAPCATLCQCDLDTTPTMYLLATAYSSQYPILNGENEVDSHRIVANRRNSSMQDTPILMAHCY
jgi:hypothetical protein